MDGEPQPQYQPPQQQPARAAEQLTAGVGGSPFDGGASFGALHGRAAGGGVASSLGMQGGASVARCTSSRAARRTEDLQAGALL